MEKLRLGWYGKLPAGGDFMHRNLAREQVLWWDRWLQRGVAGLNRASRDAQAAYLRAPLWNFVLPGGLGTELVQFGCIGPSRDRVGRNFPLVMVATMPVAVYQPEVLSHCAAFFHGLGTGMLGVLRHGRNAAQLDEALEGVAASVLRGSASTAGGAGTPAGEDILSVLNGGHETAPLSLPGDELGWADLPLYFDERAVSSYWWTNSVEAAAHRRHIHGGMLNTALFDRLFLSPVGLRGEAAERGLNRYRSHP